ncbi:XRE family transcriptional regulator [Halomonas sp. HK25]|uniref:XRE family transcriptional regulator n=1 Tax=Halomonas sp. HK25 TaxID=3394321 RepID=UPI0039FDA9BA
MSAGLQDFINQEGCVSPDALMDELNISKDELAQAIGLVYSERTRENCLYMALAQQRLFQVVTILTSIEPWAGSMSAGWSWFRHYPIAPLGGVTAENLVAQGRGDAVKAYLSHIEQGGFA